MGSTDAKAASRRAATHTSGWVQVPQPSATMAPPAEELVTITVVVAANLLEHALTVRLPVELAVYE